MLIWTALAYCRVGRYHDTVLPQYHQFRDALTYNEKDCRVAMSVTHITIDLQAASCRNHTYSIALRSTVLDRLALRNPFALHTVGRMKMQDMKFHARDKSAGHENRWHETIAYTLHCSEVNRVVVRSFVIWCSTLRFGFCALGLMFSSV